MDKLDDKVDAHKRWIFKGAHERRMNKDQQWMHTSVDDKMDDNNSAHNRHTLLHFQPTRTVDTWMVTASAASSTFIRGWSLRPPLIPRGLGLNVRICFVEALAEGLQ